MAKRTDDNNAPCRAQHRNGDDRRLWEVCMHIVRKEATEVACLPDRVAVCRKCVERFLAVPEATKVPVDGVVECPVCLKELLEDTGVVIHGREVLDWDQVWGHTHENKV